jgi:6-phosphofructokinase 1
VTNESVVDKERFVEVVEKAVANKKRSIIIIVSELIYGIDGKPTLNEIASYIKSKTNIDTRVNVLGHLQRGGTPTAMERVNATKMGIHAVNLLKNGIGGRVIGIKGDEVVDYEIMESFELKRKSRLELINKINSINVE